MSYPILVPNFKLLGRKVLEKSLTEKKVYNRQTDGQTYTQTHRQTLLRKRRKLYIPYILRMLGVKIFQRVFETEQTLNQCIITVKYNKGR